MVMLLAGCSSKKIPISNFKKSIIEVNKKIELLNRRLSSQQVFSNECRVEKSYLLAIQEENASVLDKVFKLHNLLTATHFPPNNKKEIEKSLDVALSELFTLRSESKRRLKEEEYLCNMNIKPIPKIKTCTNCLAVFR